MSTLPIPILADKENLVGNAKLIKKDFFGRVIQVVPLGEVDANSQRRKEDNMDKEKKAWVTYHEGMNNAVRKPISLNEFLKAL